MTIQSTAAAAVLRLSAISSARASLQVVCPPMRGRPSRNISSLGSSCNIARGKTKRGLLWVSNKCLEPKILVMSGSKGRMSVGEIFDRRKLLLASTIGLTIDAFLSELGNSMATAAEFADMPALRGKDYGKTKMQYSDYTKTQSGLQYKDLRVGNGPKPKMGETVVVDWDGYTVGYYGRIFEARNKAKGGSFEGDDKDFFKFKLGSQQMASGSGDDSALPPRRGITRIFRSRKSRASSAGITPTITTTAATAPPAGPAPLPTTAHTPPAATTSTHAYHSSDPHIPLGYPYTTYPALPSVYPYPPHAYFPPPSHYSTYPPPHAFHSPAPPQPAAQPDTPPSAAGSSQETRQYIEPEGDT